MPDDTKSFESNYGFLFLGYHQDAYLWEVVVMIRKGALSLCGVALTHAPGSQVKFGLLLLSICVLLHVIYKPFSNNWMNQFELLSLVISYLTFFLGTFTMDSDSDSVVYSIMACALNVAYIFVAIPVGYKLHSISRERKLLRATIKLVNINGINTGTKTTESYTDELTLTKKTEVYPEPIELAEVLVDEESEYLQTF